MKNLIKIILGIILAVIIVSASALAIFVYTNRDLAMGAFEILKSAPANNIKAAWIFLTDSSSISEKIDKNAENFDNAVNSVVGVETTLSPVVKEAIESGKYTEEEIARILLSGESAITEIENEKQQNVPADTTELPSTDTHQEPDVTVSVPDESEKESQITAQQPQDPVVDKQETITPPAYENPSSNLAPPEQNTQDTDKPAPVTAEDTAAYVAKLYIQKSRFMGYLGSIEKLIIDEYNALPKDMKIPSERKRIALAHLQTMAQMEKECDAEVANILAELKAKLVSENKDTSVVAKLMKAYEDEKSLKKARYMDVFLNGLP